MFLEQHKEDWASLLDPENIRWHPPERAISWPLKDIITNKEKERQKQSKADGNGLGFLGQKPEGVPEDVDDMVRTQVTPVREVIYAQKHTMYAQFKPLAYANLAIFLEVHMPTKPFHHLFYSVVSATAEFS